MLRYISVAGLALAVLEIRLDALLPSQPANGTHPALAGKAGSWSSGPLGASLASPSWMQQTGVTISAVQCWTVY
jgi:hypothetical protein